MASRRSVVDGAGSNFSDNAVRVGISHGALSPMGRMTKTEGPGLLHGMACSHVSYE